eukprot:CAMPEP_0198224520 /NCGR_PEP_ID=MMETSP1445-20131203/97267_1 /TAXON_ID=36898 /ORGANISM="Pyramimonas sp., Strain CCMP2087" /LENGTH=90 /DNA_ID=CAMNT_0043903725 /DNA_START=75 /DNA_END=344 /DNA_ORIENTATION=+
MSGTDSDDSEEHDPMQKLIVDKARQQAGMLRRDVAPFTSDASTIDEEGELPDTPPLKVAESEADEKESEEKGGDAVGTDVPKTPTAEDPG